MPIGTPKIPYSFHDEIPYSHHEETDDKTVFLTIQETLYNERILFLGKNMEFSLVNNIIALLLYLSGEDDTDIHLFINSHGGEALSAISLYDSIQFLYCDVSTVALGLVASTASLILVGGTRSKRIAFPHARIMIHQPCTGYFSGNPRKMQVEAEELLELRNTIAEIYAQNTGQPINVIQNDLERDTFMSATEAKDYGIIDNIAIEKFR